MSSLQTRQKWEGSSRNVHVGDIVLIKDDKIFTKRNGWPMARVVEAIPSEDGLVRQVRLRVAQKQENKARLLVRPISKVIVLVKSEDFNS